MTTLYISYGSNLNKRAMRMRCPGARPIGKIYLSHARLVFRGVADVEFAENLKSVVPCGLWAITKEDEAALDRYEGVGSGLYERWWVPATYQGKKQEALFYVMTDRSGVHPPSQHYLDTIHEGYRDFGFTKNDYKILRRSIKASWNKNPSEQTASRRERQKADPKHHRLAARPNDSAHWIDSELRVNEDHGS